MKVSLALSMITTTLLPVSTLRAQQRAPNPPATASIEGTLTDSASGQPVSGMTVNAQGPGKPEPARSSENGVYRISGLSSGTYYIVVGPGNSYVPATRYLRVQAGEKLKAIDLKLQKEAIIAGRVLDRDKNPVPNGYVTVWGPGYLHGRPTIRGMSSARTNDLGEYRVGRLMPGPYYVEITPKPIDIQERKLIAGKEAQEKPLTMANVKTYYPNSTSIEGASLVTLRAGEVRQALDITLLNEKTVCVISSVADPEASAAQVPRVTLWETYPGGESLVAGGNIRAGSYFEACGIGPGSYRISAVIPPPEGQEDGLRYASEIFTVGDTTVRLPPLNLQPSFPLSGTVTVSGEKTDDPLPSGLHFSLAPKDRFLNYGENTSAKEDSTGKFTFPAMTADQYWLDIFGIPSGYYVKQARLGVNDILSAPFFAAPGAEIEIVLGSDGPSISGQVTDSDNQPVADATVVLATNPPQSTRADQDGRFTLNGMAPGDYRIAAFRGLQDGLAEDPNFIQANFGRATELTLGPSATVSVNLTAQPTN